MDNDVGPVFEWTAQCWRRDRIVDNKGYPVAMCHVGDGADVGHIAGRIAYGFAKYRFGVFVNQGVNGSDVIVRREFDRDALTGKRMGEQVVSAPVKGTDRYNVVSGLGKGDRKSTRLNSSHVAISYAVFCL